MKTIEEVEKLKEGWKKDPCWDIEDTEGFEEYRDELHSFRLQYEHECNLKWEVEREKLFRHANVMVSNRDNQYDGISKLELFSAMAMQTLIQSHPGADPDFISKTAIAHANSLLLYLDNNP